MSQRRFSPQSQLLRNEGTPTVRAFFDEKTNFLSAAEFDSAGFPE
jgi:hypothetical protein